MCYVATHIVMISTFGGFSAIPLAHLRLPLGCAIPSGNVFLIYWFASGEIFCNLDPISNA